MVAGAHSLLMNLKLKSGNSKPKKRKNKNNNNKKQAVQTVKIISYWNHPRFLKQRSLGWRVWLFHMAGDVFILDNHQALALKNKKNQLSGFILHIATERSFFFLVHLDENLLERTNMIRKGWNGKWGQEKELKPKPGYEDVFHQLCHTCQDYR